MKCPFPLISFLGIVYASVIHNAISTPNSPLLVDRESENLLERNSLVPRFGPVPAKNQRVGGSSEDPYVPGDGEPAMARLGAQSEETLAHYRSLLERNPDVPREVVTVKVSDTKNAQIDGNTKIVVGAKGANNKEFIDIVYGNGMKTHADHAQFYKEAHPDLWELGFDPLVPDEDRPDDVETEAEEHKGNRGDALRSLHTDEDFDRDEKPFASTDVGGTQATVAYVPKYESHFEGSLVNKAKELAKEHGLPIRFVDGRTGKAKEFTCMILKGPTLKGGKWNVPHWVDVKHSTAPIPVLKRGAPRGSKDPQDYDLVDPSDVWSLLNRRWIAVPSFNKRQIGILTTQEQQGNNGTQTTESQEATYEDYLWAFDLIQTRAAAVVFPVLDEMLNNTNAPAMYDAAWSIYTDLTMPGVSVMGPFSNGMNFFNGYETSAMTFANEAQVIAMYAYDAVLIGQYNYYFSKCVNALNTTSIDGSGKSLLSDLTTFATALAALAATNDTGIVPEIDMVIDTSEQWTYFTIYNETYPPAIPGLNTTSTTPNNVTGNENSSSSLWSNSTTALLDTLLSANLTGNAKHGWNNETTEVIELMNSTNADTNTSTAPSPSTSTFTAQAKTKTKSESKRHERGKFHH